MELVVLVELAVVLVVHVELVVPGEWYFWYFGYFGYFGCGTSGTSGTSGTTGAVLRGRVALRVLVGNKRNKWHEGNIFLLYSWK